MENAHQQILYALTKTTFHTTVQVCAQTGTVKILKASLHSSSVLPHTIMQCL
jgi:hypothetical protein